MTVIVIQFDQIQSITERGIAYHNESGATVFIYFEACYQNHLDTRLSQDAYEQYLAANPTQPISYDVYAARRRAWREVGHRNVMGEYVGWLANMIYEGRGKPFVVLHTQPPTAIECESHETFQELCDAITQYGWDIFNE